MSESAPGMPPNTRMGLRTQRAVFGITKEGDRWEVSRFFDGCWRGAVRADTLDEAAALAVKWHLLGEWPVREPREPAG